MRRSAERRNSNSSERRPHPCLTIFSTMQSLMVDSLMYRLTSMNASQERTSRSTGTRMQGTTTCNIYARNERSIKVDISGSIFADYGPMLIWYNTDQPSYQTPRRLSNLVLAKVPCIARLVHAERPSSGDARTMGIGGVKSSDAERKPKTQIAKRYLGRERSSRMQCGRRKVWI